MRRKLFHILSLLTILAMLAVPVSAQNGSTASEETRFDRNSIVGVNPSEVQAAGNPNAIVFNEVKGAGGIASYTILLSDAPLASYRGGAAGLAATSPTVTGARKLDPSSPASRAYIQYLKGKQSQFLSAAGDALGRQVTARFSYQHALNGLTADLTPAEAAQIARLPGVRLVQRDQVYYTDTDSGPAWIGAPGIWDGTTTGGLPGTQGEGIIIGVIDSGINFDHPSFAEVGPVDSYVHVNPLGSGTFLGWCDPANPNYNAAYACNDKLIGAWDFVDNLVPVGGYELIGPEDEDGHGSHTASTSAGNTVNAELIAPTLTLTRTISGVAPHANIIAYDACYFDPATNTGPCPGEATLASIEQAVVDGVDVINYSIGGGSDPYNSAGELAFLSAFEAGIFVSTSAGNSGPGASTTGHNSPWVSATAAATHNRIFRNAVIDMTGGDTTPPADLIGKGFTTGYGPAPIVYSANYVVPPATAEDARLCKPGAFPAGTFTGQIVVCDRGIYARVDKAQAVADGGAGGYVLANAAANGEATVGDAYAIPGVHLGFTDGNTLKTWMASGSGHTATIQGVYGDVSPDNGDVLADFSSRGPNLAIDLLKPDLTAPGVDILAAVNTPDPANPGPPEYDFLSGTSMSSPHTAGSGILLSALQPTWSPAEILSALMLTSDSTVLKEDGATPGTFFDKGAGRVDLSVAGLAGFVLDETAVNMEAANPGTGGDPRTLNLPSFTDSSCLQECSWTRELKSTQAVTVTWTASVASADGITLTVTPATFDLSAGGLQQIQVSAGVIGLPLNTWAFGEVTLTPDDPAIPAARFPVAVEPSAGIIPGLVEFDTRRNAGSELLAGLQSVAITDLTTESFGLAQATLTSQELNQDPTNGDPYDNLNDGTVFTVNVTVPSGAKRLVAEIITSEAPDIDLFVGTGSAPSAGSVVCTSATAAALEYCDITDPAAGEYWILVQNWEDSSSPPDLVTLASAVVPGTDDGNMTFSGPSSVPAGTPFDLRLIWDTPTMMAGDRWYGAFSLGTDAANPGNIATVPVNIIRASDDVTKTASPTSVMPGETVTFTVTVQPNITAEDLAYTITDTVPSGWTYVPGSAAVDAGSFTESGGQIVWNVTMQVPELGYEMSTSAANPMCDTGFGGYVNLADVPINPQAAITGDSVAFTAFTTGNPINFYGVNYVGASFTDDGFVLFDAATQYAGSPWVPQTLPNATKPNNVAAMLWQDLEIFYAAPPTTHGVSLATAGGTGADGVVVIEYDDIQFFGGSADTFDFEAVIARSVNDTPGYYEVVYAYDNLNGDLSGPLTVGLENAAGTAGMALVNNASATGVITNGLMVCFDYTTLGANPVSLTYQATAPANLTAGAAILTPVQHTVDGIGAKPASAAPDLSVAEARLQVAHLAPFAAGSTATSVTVALNGTDVLTDFVYGESTGYVSLLPGSYMVQIFPTGSATPAISETVALSDGMDYTAIAVGGANSQPLDLLALVDNNAAPAAGNFHLRLGHLAPFASVITDTLADVRLQDGTPVLTGVPYGAVAGYTPLAAGTYDLKITAPGGAPTLINPDPVAFSAGQIVSAFAVGDGVNQPLGVYALPSGSPGFFVPLTVYKLFWPLVFGP